VYNIKQPDFHDLNSILSNQIASFLFPTITRKSSESGVLKKSFYPFEDTVLHLLRQPEYKLLGIRYVPQMPEQSKSFSVESWAALEKRLSMMLIGASTEASIN